MSSCEITKTAAPVLDRLCSFRETDVTFTFIRSSRLSWVKSDGGPALTVATTRTRLTLRVARQADVFIRILTGNLRARKAPTRI
jgi:hypothetical protein